MNETVLILKEGKVGINRADSRLRDMNGPCVLFANKILETKDTLTAESLTECKLAKIEKDLLISLLESDAYLSLRFFLHIATQLIEQLYDYNVISQSVKHSLSKSKILARSTGHLVVKPNSTDSNPNIFTDPKQIRDVEFRKIFHYQDKEIIIKGPPSFFYFFIFLFFHFFILNIQYFHFFIIFFILFFFFSAYNQLSTLLDKSYLNFCTPFLKKNLKITEIKNGI